MATRRLDTIASHVAHDVPISMEKEEVVENEEKLVEKVMRGTLKLEDEGAREAYSMEIAGPLASGADRKEIVKEMARASFEGKEHMKWEEYQRAHGGKAGMSANIVVPVVRFFRENETGKIKMPVVQNNVVVSDPEDCQRLVAKHLQKQGHFTPAFTKSVISTTDNDHWRLQRKELTPAFMPLTSLKEIFPISLARGKHCVGKLLDESLNGTQQVDMNEFLLHEAMAQLRLALFGESEETMNKINKPYRDAMSGKLEGRTDLAVKGMYKDMLDNMSSKCPAHQRSTGPLARQMMHSGCPADKYTATGNAGIFSFAGHDTTGHTMTWMLYELAKQPDLQARLQQEVDELWRKVDSEGRDLVYEDFKELPFMTRCVMETLRLWPAVPNGTFRVLEEDDWVKGKDGKKVWLPKGTNVQISTWSRHRNADLWGEDVLVFNPDRQFQDKELWDHRVLSAVNPHTERFSPFTYPPRDCIGRNFAQMEIRVIMMHLLRKFTFKLTDVNARNDPTTFQGVNYGTMAPQNVLYNGMVKRNRQMGGGVGAKTATGLLLFPTLRH